MAAERFPIRFTGANRSLSLLGLSPGKSWVEVRDEELEVRMGWAFRLTAPRSGVARAAPDTGRVGGWGVHGWRGRWLVNGSSSGLVRIDFEPAARARTGPVPIAVRELRVSLVDPDALLAALGPAASR